MPDDIVAHLDRAIYFAGSQRALADLLGVSPNCVNAARKRGTVTAEFADNVERVTKGFVTRHQLRPDLFPPTPRKKRRLKAAEEATS